MSKKAPLLLILALLVMVSSLPGSATVGEGKSIQYNLIIRTNDDVNRFSLDTKLFTCYFNNGSDYMIEAGEDYSIEVRKGLRWERHGASIYVKMLLYFLKPGMSSPIYVLLNWDEVQEVPLTEGHYRVRKDVTVNGEEASAFFEFYMIP
ncbi:MAG: hypothetical protein LBD12_01775 [Clostridiales Family XIII bacterium]|nr:hypothetical protein [Clostridiales Family XIII bacterium]